MSELTAVTGGKMNGMFALVVTMMTPGLPLVNTKTNRRKTAMKRNKSWNCEECTHSMQETTDDVACCNCCEDGSFFEEYRDEYTLADLGRNWW